MLRVLFGALYPTLALPLFLRWSTSQVEGQIDKMQQAVFNTPGAEAPVPPIVIVGGAGLTAGYFAYARALRLGLARTAVCLLLGGAAGAALYLAQPPQKPSQKRR